MSLSLCSWFCYYITTFLLTGSSFDCYTSLMLLTPHSTLGSTIAKKINNPFLSLPLVFLTHFLADTIIPHWNPHIYTELEKNKTIGRKNFAIILADFLLSLLLSFSFASKALPDAKKAVIIFSGGIVAILPDFFEIPFYFVGSRNKWLVKYVKFHHRHQIDVSFIPGMAIQIAIIALCCYLF